MTPRETNAESDTDSSSLVRSSSTTFPPDNVVGPLGSVDAKSAHSRTTSGRRCPRLCGNAVTLSGQPADVALAERVVSELVAIVASGQTLTPDAVKRSVAMLTGIATLRFTASGVSGWPLATIAISSETTRSASATSAGSPDSVTALPRTWTSAARSRSRVRRFASAEPSRPTTWSGGTLMLLRTSELLSVSDSALVSRGVTWGFLPAFCFWPGGSAEKPQFTAADGRNPTVNPSRRRRCAGPARAAASRWAPSFAPPGRQRPQRAQSDGGGRRGPQHRRAQPHGAAPASVSAASSSSAIPPSGPTTSISESARPPASRSIDGVADSCSTSTVVELLSRSAPPAPPSTPHR